MQPSFPRENSTSVIEQSLRDYSGALLKVKNITTRNCDSSRAKNLVVALRGATGPSRAAPYGKIVYDIIRSELLRSLNVSAFETHCHVCQLSHEHKYFAVELCLGAP